MDLEKRTIVSKGLQPDHFSNPPESQKVPAGTVSSQYDSESSHAKFCRIIGMPAGGNGEPYPSSIWDIRNKKEKKYVGLYPRVKAAYQWHTLQYWLVAVVSNTLLIVTICFGAILTALGSIKSDRVSIPIIVLGALQTVFGGFTTYFKSRNQPNRARQFRISLKRVLEAMDNAEGMLRDKDYVPPGYTPVMTNVGNNTSPDDSGTGALPGVVVQGVQGMVLRLMDMYMDAVREAEANYPDYWLSSQPVTNNEQHLVMKDILTELRRSGALTDPSSASTAAMKTSGDTPSAQNQDGDFVSERIVSNARNNMTAALNNVSSVAATAAAVADAERANFGLAPSSAPSSRHVGGV